MSTPLHVYAKTTPNPATMKFAVNLPLLPNQSAECTSAEMAGTDDLIWALFRFSYIKSVYIASNFVTLTKVEGIEWYEYMNEIRTYIRDFLEAGNPVLTKMPPKKLAIHPVGQEPLPESEIDAKITEILDEYIRPAVEQDWGEIAYRGFKDGIVYVAMRGSCAGCPSSTLTLKAGIEQLLKRMIPGVEQVVAENDLEQV